MVQETTLQVSDLVLPLFVQEGENLKTAIPAMPGCYRYSLDQLLIVAKQAYELGIPAIALFPVIADAKKDSYAKESSNPNGLLPRSISALKKALPNLCLITDVAMDPYSSDGHDGLVREGQIINDETLEILCQMAITQARAGADMIAPSDMMDGRIGYLRQGLDEEGFSDVSILSYAVKYASAFYGPFREALDSSPKSGDKKSYQMNPANKKEAAREVFLDEEQGADIVMVKPALAYLDVVSLVKQETLLPVAAYNVSGEYSMVKAAVAQGWLDEKSVVLESLISIKRAGADMIFTYHALDAAKWLANAPTPT
jgi:porphobilinogen synthase